MTTLVVARKPEQPVKGVWGLEAPLGLREGLRKYLVTEHHNSCECHEPAGSTDATEDNQKERR